MFSILYADDEPSMLEICRLFLEGTGEFAVTTVRSGQEALDELARHNFDAVISDYQMPGMDGLAFLKTVREESGDIPFILFTGRGREDVVIEAINSGADFYLQKGGDPRALFAELAHKIRQAVSRKKAEIALSDSKRRLADIIEFLPDATFAIDTDGNVIAWNRAIVEMTGVPAAEILGKGEYEYALPFYGERRPNLIDLLSGPDEKIAQYYSNIIRDGHTLSAETNLSPPRGKRIDVLVKASPLYNRDGEITGAIETIRDITERRKSETELRTAYEQVTLAEEEQRSQYEELSRGEEQLRESEERYRSLVELFPDAVVVHRDGKILYANPEAVRLAGAVHAEDLIGMDSQALIHPDEREMAKEELRRIVEKGRMTPLQEKRLLRIDGRPFVAEVAAMPILYQHLPSVMVVFRDITERKRMEEADHRQERFLEDIFSCIRDGISVLDRTMTIVRTNKIMEEWYSHEMPLVGKKCWDAYHGRTERCKVCPTITTLETGRPARERVPLVDAGTTTGWIDLYSYPLIDSVSGEMTGAIEYVRNITEEMRAQEALREKSEELDQFFTTSLDLFCIADTNGIFRHLNPEWEKTLGYTLAELEGKRFLDFVHPDDMEATLVAIADLNQQRDVINFTNRFRCRDGSYRWIEWRSRAQGTLIYAAARDITEMKRSENAIRESSRKLNLLNNITRHDVTNQLTAVLGYTQLAMIKKPDPVVADFLGKITAAVNTIRHQIEFTRNYQELGEQSPAWQRIADIIQALKPPNITITSTCGPCEIFADPMLDKVFSNLFDNAVRHGEKTTAIAVRCDVVSGELVITVSDNGVGIPLDQKQKIFEKGYGRHTGFGLFLAREILAITGISIHETGVHMKGARFEIAVPKGGYRRGGGDGSR